MIQGSLFQIGVLHMCTQDLDVLYQAAAMWKELTEYCYIITYGYKAHLYTIQLTFSPEDFPHLAGFHYLKDLSLPRYNPVKSIEKILSHSLTAKQISKSLNYNQLVWPRLQALVHLKKALESDFSLFSYMPRMYPFTTMIKADYLISSRLNPQLFVFLRKSNSGDSPGQSYLCCSTFIKDVRDYEVNQRIRTILKKERLCIPTQTSSVFYNRLDKSHT